jgi:hypothetical protein
MLFTIHKKYKKTNLIIAGAIIVLFTISGCKKFIEVDFPETSNNANVVYNTDAQAIGVLTGIYAKMGATILSNLSNPVILGMPIYSGLSSDELTLFDKNNTTLGPYYTNSLSSQIPSSFWSDIYSTVFVTNSALEGLNSSTGLTPSVKQQLLGEAKFIRAFCYFYLVNLFGDVPLILGTNYKQNAMLARTSKDQVYQQIILDLKDAQDLLSEKYLDGSLTAYSAKPEKVRPTKWAATALLARTYLYTGKWTDAEAQATSVISISTVFSLDTLNGVFLKNSKEAIWQLQPVKNGVYSNTQEGAFFKLPSTGPDITGYPVYLSNNVLNSFEPNDQRKSKWTDSVVVSISGVPKAFYFTSKYKIGQVNTAVAEYSMVLRLAEQYLIRAEARAQQNNLGNAIADLDMIRQRAGLPLVANTNPGISQSALLDKIFHERQVELFTEWGHRWFDLKRTGKVDAVMSIVTPQKGGTWETTDQLYPIPVTELQRNPNLTQNPGY